MKLKTIKKEVTERETEIEIELPFYYKIDDFGLAYGVIYDEKRELYFRAYQSGGFFISAGALSKPEKIAQMIPITKDEFDQYMEVMTTNAAACGVSVSTSH